MCDKTDKDGQQGWDVSRELLRELRKHLIEPETCPRLSTQPQSWPGVSETGSAGSLPMSLLQRFKRAPSSRQDASRTNGSNSLLEKATSNASSTTVSTQFSGSTQAGPSVQLHQNLWERAYQDLCVKDARFRRVMDAFLFDLAESETAQPQAIGQMMPNILPRAHPDLLLKVISSRLEAIERSRFRFNIGEYDIVVREKVEKILTRIMSFQGLIDSAARLDKHASIAWAGVSVVLAVILQAARQTTVAVAALEEISEILCRYDVIERLYLRTNIDSQDPASEKLSKHKDLQRLQISLESTIVKLFSLVLETQVRLARHYSKSQGLRLLSDIAIPDDWNASLQELKRLDSRIKNTLEMFDSDAMNTLIEQCLLMEANVLTGIKSMQANYLTAEARRAISSLPRVPSADFRSHQMEYDAECLPNTRTELLAEIMEWCGDCQAPSIFWLCGMAGTGKTTIVRTLARTLFESSKLAANFFFSRFDIERSSATRFVSTIAAQIAEAFPVTADAIAKAIRDNLDIHERNLREQWEKLVYGPLSQVKKPPNQPMVIVIDALDECMKDDDIKRLLALFTTIQSITCVNLKLFLTSRPETEILLGFRHMSKTHFCDFILQNVEDTIVERDLAILFDYHLKLIRQKNEFTGDEWPAPQNVKALVKKSGKSFIYAATICRYLEDDDYDPRSRLQHLLTSHVTSYSATKQVDDMYLTILESSMKMGIDENDNQCLILEFHDVVDPIIVACEPLSLDILSQLTGSPMDRIRRRLRRLSSVLDVPTSSFDQPIHILHPSFPEFLLEKERCSKQNLQHFMVQKRKAHARMGDCCLRLLNNSLGRNICRLRSPGTLVNDLGSNTIEKYISSSVRYASRFWLEHLLQSDETFDDSSPVLQFLKKNFLYWLEVLGLINRVDDSVRMILQLEVEVKNQTSEFARFMYDAKRFILLNRRPIEIAPLQIYFSSMTFIAKKSLIGTLFEKEKPQCFQQPVTNEDEWPAALLVLEGHTDFVTVVAFSPNGQLVTSASYDYTIRLWETATGTLRAILSDHCDTVSTIIFSPDGLLIISASHDNTVRIAATDTGTSLVVLVAGLNWATTVAISSDGELLAFVLPDNIIQIWSITNNTTQAILQGHSKSINKVIFSPDGRTLASVSADTTLRLWSTLSGTLLGVLEGHSHSVMDVVFLPNGGQIASASNDKIAKLWNIASGACQDTIQDHSESIREIALSPNGQLVAAVPDDNTVQLWDTEKRGSPATLKGHADWVTGILFSPDGQLIASGSRDTTVRLWDTTTGSCQAVLQGHSSAVTTLAFSSKGRLVASASVDMTVRLWDATMATGGSQTRSDHHSGLIGTIVFSPDGLLIASGSRDKTIRLWDNTGALKAVLKGHIDWVKDVFFSPNGQMLASASYNGTIMLWDVQLVRPPIELEPGSPLQELFHLSRIQAWEEVDRTYSVDTTTLSFANLTITNDSKLSLDSSRSWVTWQDEKWLWLPSDFRPTAFAAAHTTLCLGTSTGRITFLVIKKSVDSISVDGS